ncbi:c-type cytochrome biogenesis protein CcmI [Colwellia psychrerythraea]|uniref:Cytochrome c-type biogenesis protein CcmI n=1 Tax=Colwellia psychrerythraea TaxID=28229 RepID=A0A099KLF0_COLPS|nr:c-type cytochrome biogenesis protein CcmI [Colwellia psychrerythraea]KGJ90453.1 cytochrome c-type biogenesis protein CcmI [Colwellia psychrerythraea]
MEFLIIGLIFLILLLLMVWRPFFKQKTQQVSVNGNLRDETNVRLYHEHKQEIEKDYNENRMDEENYQYLLAELDNTLLQDIESTTKADNLAIGKGKKYSPFWPLGLSVFIIIFSVALYNKQGSYKLITELPAGHGQQQAMSADKMLKQREIQAMAHIEKLQQHIEATPEDSEAWYNLGQTYVAVGSFDEAIAAFTQVMKIEGEHADLLGAIAQALYYKNDQQINAQVQEYIDKALALDVNDASTNILLGMHNFIGENYQSAITYWQRVIDENNKGVNIEALKEAVAEAKNRLGNFASNSAANSASNSALNQEAKTQEQASSGPQLKVSVSLSDDIAKQLAQGEDRVVFIYAVPTNGQRMPLAAVKMKASDLPTVIVLNNSQAMSSEHTIGSVEKVHVYAIVSMQGGVGIKSGDYKAEALGIEVNRSETLELIVNKLVE